jgi:membrane protein YqaA with SNARE-associated domain
VLPWVKTSSLGAQPFYLPPLFYGLGSVPHNAATAVFNRFAYNDRLLARNKLWLKITGWIAVLQTLGAWGVLVLTAIDSGAIPIPVDALVAGYVYSNPHRAWLFVLAGALGSALGSLVPYYLGRAGGELFLLKRINRQRMERIRDRFERQEFLALMVPAMLPPPTPFKLFVFSAGVFEMKPLVFLAAVFAGRVARFGVLSVLTVIFGPQIVTQAKTLIREHPSLAVLIAFVVLLLAYLVFRLLRAPAREVAEELGKDPSADR